MNRAERRRAVKQVGGFKRQNRKYAMWTKDGFNAQLEYERQRKVDAAKNKESAVAPK